MADGIFTQFGLTFPSIEEMEAYKIEKRAEIASQFPQGEEVSEGLTVSTPTVKPTLQPRDKPKQEPYTEMYNGVATNLLANISTRTQPPEVDAITGEAKIQRGSLTAFIDSYNELSSEIRVSTLKLLDICTIALTHQTHYKDPIRDRSDRTVVIPLEKYMDMCGIPHTKASKDKIRRRVREDLELLYHISLAWTENGGKNRVKDFAKMRICDYISLKNGNMEFSFSEDMAKYLINAYVTQYSLALLQADERNPSIYRLGRKLLNHHSNDNNQRNGTANILRVSKLLEVCPEIPSYEQVMNTDRAVERRIITPFENALDGVPLLKWEYSNAKGEPLTEEQLATRREYKTFAALYICFSFEETKDQSARQERNQKKIAEAKKRAAPRRAAKEKKKAE